MMLHKIDRRHEAKGPRGSLRVLQVLVVMVAVIGAVLVVVGAANRVHPASDDVATAPVGDTMSSLFATQSLLIVGDSFPGGTGDPDIETYPEILSRITGWNVRVDAQGGTGFVNSFGSTVPLIERLDSDRRRFTPNFILVDAGRNDLGIDPVKVTQAAQAYFDRLTQSFPGVRIAIIMPSYVTKVPADNYVYLRNGLQAIADKIGAGVIDPVKESWYTDIDLKSLLIYDGVHFNAAGNKFYADKIGKRLRELGFPIGTSGVK